MFHQRGPISLMSHLRNENVLKQTDSLLFLTPCHSTPYFSYLHRNVSMRFLTCEPNLNPNLIDYEDEADRFYSNPEEWLLKNYNYLKSVTHLVLFENFYHQLSAIQNHQIKKFLQQFQICKSFYHSFINTNKRNDKSLLLMCLSASDYSNNNNTGTKIEL